MTNEENDMPGQVAYQETVGSLLYLAQGTRPDIAFALNDVSRFNSRHSEQHWEAVIRIIRYLSGTEKTQVFPLFVLCWKWTNAPEDAMSLLQFGKRLHRISKVDNNLKMNLYVTDIKKISWIDIIAISFHSWQLFIFKLKTKIRISRISGGYERKNNHFISSFKIELRS